MRYPGAPVWKFLLCCMLAETGRLTESEEILENAATDDFASLRTHLLTGAESYSLLGDACSAIGRSDLASRLYELLLGAEDQRLSVGNLIGFGTAARPLVRWAAPLARVLDDETGSGQPVACRVPCLFA